MKNTFIILILTGITLTLSAQAVDSTGCTGALGDVKYSMLDEVAFIAENGDCWVMMDGRNVASSNLAQYLPSNTIPDPRGYFLRSYDTRTTGRVDKDRTPTDAVGQPQNDAFEEHQHELTNFDPNGSFLATEGGSTRRIIQHQANYSGRLTGTAGGSETRPKNISMNIYIRIN